MSVHGVDLTMRASQLPELRNSLGQSTCRWMREIALRTRNMDDLICNPSFIYTGIWYPNRHFEAMKKLLVMKDYAEEARKIYDYFLKNYAYTIGYVNPEYFDPIPETLPERKVTYMGGLRSLHFLVRQDVLPSVAIKAALIGPTLIDCGVACQIARYGALLDRLGERKFNIIFGSSSKGQRMNIGYLIDDDLQPMRYFVEFTFESILYGMVHNSNHGEKEVMVGKIGARNIKVGQLVQIRGVATHWLKHPWDENGSHNLICCQDTPGEQLFLGLGTKDEGAREVEIGEGFVKKYNKPTDWDNKLPEMQTEQNREISKPYAAHKVDALYSEKMEGFDCGSIQEFKVDLIQDLIDLPEDQVSMDFVKRHHSQKQEHNLAKMNGRMRQFYSG